MLEKNDQAPDQNRHILAMAQRFDVDADDGVPSLCHGDDRKRPE
jgi:hypothetical protein